MHMCILQCIYPKVGFRGTGILRKNKRENFISSFLYSMIYKYSFFWNTLNDTQMITCYIFNTLGNLWSKWGNQKDKVLRLYGLKYKITIQGSVMRKEWVKRGGKSGWRGKGMGYTEQGRQGQLLGILELFLNKCSWIYNLCQSILS